MTNTDKYRQTLTTFWNFWERRISGDGFFVPRNERGTAGTTLSVPRNERGTAGTDFFFVPCSAGMKRAVPAVPPQTSSKSRKTNPPPRKLFISRTVGRTVGTPLFISLRPHRSFVLALACTQLNKKKNRSKKLPPEGSSSLILTGTC